MKKTILIGVFIFTPAVLSAGQLVFGSQAGLSNNRTASTVTVTANPAWDVNELTGKWISYADTGWGGAVFQPYLGETPAMTVYHEFTSAAGQLDLTVWADDTAAVYLDNMLLFAPVFTQSTCSGQPIGCRPEDAGHISTHVGVGSHLLELRVYQVGGGGDTLLNPFGVKYEGMVSWADPVATPEPSSYALFGAGLAGIAIWRKRKSA